MSRATAGFDRAATAVVGLAAIGAGVAAIAWQRGMFPENRDVVNAPGLVSAESASWWPWALGAAAVLLILLGLRWLLAHRPYRRVGAVALDTSVPGGSATAGTLSTDLTYAARCAADSLADRPGVRSATGRAVSDRGQRVVEITAVFDPDSTTGIADAAQATERDLTSALDGASVSTRILLGIGKTRSRTV